MRILGSWQMSASILATSDLSGLRSSRRGTDSRRTPFVSSVGSAQLCLRWVMPFAGIPWASPQTSDGA